MRISILYFDSVGSTNTEAVEQARRGAAEGLCIVADRQTAGRGRHGRRWSSPANSGLYFSIVLRPGLEAKFLPLITLAAGVAVHDTIAEFGITADIKWVNDIHVNNKKISGILSESTETNTGTAVIVGIGINLAAGDFPPEIAESATSIAAETGRPVRREDVLSALVKNFDSIYETLAAGDGPSAIVREWTRRSTYADGKQVSVQLENESITGTTAGIEYNGALRVKTDAGDVRIIQAGDVEQLRPAR